MKVVWDRDDVVVAEVLDALKPRRLHYNTVMTVMSRLARKGYLITYRRGRAHGYRPGIRRESVSRAYLEAVTRHFFGGSVPRTVAALLGGGSETVRGEARLNRLLHRLERRPR